MATVTVLEMKPLDVNQLLSEAGRIARGETMMQGRTAHVQALYAILVRVADPHNISEADWKEIQTVLGKKG